MFINLILKKTLALLADDFKKPEINSLEIEVFRPENSFGDYATNLAFFLSQLLNCSAKEAAELIVKKLKELNLAFEIEKIEEKNGFINFWVRDTYLIDHSRKILLKNKYFRPTRKTLVIDYSSPNIARSFGIGHFRSTNIGNALYRLYKFLGWRVIGDNHLGDWGTQFGVLIYQIKENYLKGKSLSEAKPLLKKLTLADLEKWYQDFHSALARQPELEEKARYWFKKLEEGDGEARLIWTYCVKISLKEFSQLYRLLGVRFDYQLGESFYSDKMTEIIDLLKEKKLLKESNGAQIVELAPLPPALIVKSDGATTYFLRDLAALKFRLDKFKPQLIIYEVGSEQKLYFQQLFSVAEKLGWTEKCQLVHLAHGLLRFEGAKLSTRQGRTFHLKDIIQEAEERVKKLVSKPLNRGAIKAIALGALKYNDLNQHPSQDIVFDWDKILNLEGNSSPYLQYTYSRIQSVLKRATFKFGPLFLKSPLKLEERNVLRLMLYFPEIIKESAEKFSPHLLCQYLFQLAQAYNNLYNNLSILKAETKEKMILRLKISRATAKIIKISLNLLGIQVLRRM